MELTINYTGTQSFINTISNSLPLALGISLNPDSFVIQSIGVQTFQPIILITRRVLFCIS